jgi:hypothetical protein
MIKKLSKIIFVIVISIVLVASIAYKRNAQALTYEQIKNWLRS